MRIALRNMFSCSSLDFVVERVDDAPKNVLPTIDKVVYLAAAIGWLLISSWIGAPRLPVIDRSCTNAARPTQATPLGHSENFETITSSPFTDHNHTADYHAFIWRVRVIDVHLPVQ
jgi:hypothetical protein